MKIFKKKHKEEIYIIVLVLRWGNNNGKIIVEELEQFTIEVH